MSKFCTNCGSVIPADKKFCAECGTNATVSEETVDVSPSPQPAQHSIPQSNQTHQHQQTFSTQNFDTPPAKGSKYEPISACGYIGIMLLMCIPVVGLILMIVWACGGCRKVNKRSFARACLVMLIIATIIGIAGLFVAKKVFKTIEHEFQIQTNQITNEITNNTNNTTEQINTTNIDNISTDLEELDDFSNLGSLIENFKGLTDLINLNNK